MAKKLYKRQEEERIKHDGGGGKRKGMWDCILGTKNIESESCEEKETKERERGEKCHVLFRRCV